MPLIAALEVPKAGAARRTQDFLTRPWTLVVLGGDPAVVAAAAQPAPAARRAAHEETRRVIITVTLNAAIDKTLAVPNFQPGRRHRTVEQTTMPGGKGVNIARVLKTLGQPVIATGLAGGADRHADRRAAHGDVACCRTSCASARSRAPTPR